MTGGSVGGGGVAVGTVGLAESIGEAVRLADDGDGRAGLGALVTAAVGRALDSIVESHAMSASARTNEKHVRVRIAKMTAITCRTVTGSSTGSSFDTRVPRG
jgi:hypothetical protein